MRLAGAEGLSGPLSAQAHAPDRPSGADKKEIQNEGESRPGHFGPRSDRAEIAANRHTCPLHASGRVVPNGKRGITAEEARTGMLLADACPRTQVANASGIVTYSVSPGPSRNGSCECCPQSYSIGLRRSPPTLADIPRRDRTRARLVAFPR